METAKCNSTYRRYNDYLYDLEVLENIRLYDDYEAYKQDRLIALQAQKPMPTLESKREKLSRLVSQDYRIGYNKELELRTNESLLALDKPKEVEDEIDGVFVSDKVCSTYFTYGHTFSDVQSIIEKYDLESGEEVFKRGLGETEALTGSVEKKRGMQLTDAQIESMGTTAPVDTDMEQPSLDEEDEDEEQPQLELFSSDLVTDIDEDRINPIIGSVPDPEPEFVVKGSSDLVEDNEVDMTGVSTTETEADTKVETEVKVETESDTEAAPEQGVNTSELEAMRYLQSGYSNPFPEPSEPVEPASEHSSESPEIDSNGIKQVPDADVDKYLDDDDEDYVDDEDEDDTEGIDETDTAVEVEQELEPVHTEQEQAEQVTDDVHPVETIPDTNEDDEEYLDDDEEYLDDEDSEDDEEYLDDEDGEELDSDNDNVSDESPTDAEVPVNPSPSVEQPSQATGYSHPQEQSTEYSHPQEQSQEPFNLDTSDVNIDFNGNNGRASPVQQPVQPVQNRAEPVQKADSQGVTDEEKHDLRLFLRHHPRCEYSLVSQYFSKKEIQDNITRGKIIKRGKTLRLI